MINFIQLLITISDIKIASGTNADIHYEEKEIGKIDAENIEIEKNGVTEYVNST